MTRSLARPALGAAAALALLLTGCGEKAADAGAAGSSSSTATIDAALGARFSGGTAGAADTSKSPVKVGLINQEGGQVSNPEASAAVQAAFDYVNAEQGGIGGHPLQLEVCKVTATEESAQQCAQQFLNAGDVDVVMQGGLNVGTEAVHNTLDGAKPDVVALANPGADTTAANTFAVNPSVLAALPGVGTYARSKGYGSLAIVTASDPGSLAIGQAAQGVFGGMGLTSTVTTYPAGSGDLTSTYTSALSSKPDALAPTVVTTSDCLATAKALQAVGSATPVLGSSLCATQDLQQAFGGFPKWAYESTTLSLFAPDETGQVDFYRAVMAKYAGRNAQLGVDAPQSFGAAFLLADVLNTVGADNLSPQSISAGLQAYTGGVLLGTPRVAFGSVQGMPTLGGIADRFYTYDGTAWTAGDWQNVPA
jgi:branched-chain amino acid transport system substrate-binding protein